jgi:hypothetical protein
MDWAVLIFLLVVLGVIAQFGSRAALKRMPGLLSNNAFCAEGADRFAAVDDGCRPRCVNPLCRAACRAGTQFCRRYGANMPDRT